MDRHSIVLLSPEIPNLTITESLERLADDKDFGRYLAWRVMAAPAKLNDTGRGSVPWRVVGRYYPRLETTSIRLISGVLTVLSKDFSKAITLSENRRFVLLDIPWATVSRFDEDTGVILAQALSEVFCGITLSKELRFPFAVSTYGQGLIIGHTFRSHEEFKMVFSEGSSKYLCDG